jgi:hypothetical protein
MLTNKHHNRHYRRICQTVNEKNCNKDEDLPSEQDPLDRSVSLPFWFADITGKEEVIQISDTGLDIDNDYFYDKRAKCSTNFPKDETGEFVKDCR